MTGRLARKGAPDTFDVGGLIHMVRRLKANAEEEVAVPVFDRNLEIARGAARLIPRTTDVILVEGNYLLSTSGPWSRLASLFDLTVLLEVPEPILRERLLARWRSHGHTGAEATEKAERNDIPNGRFVRDTSLKPDFVLHESD